MLKEMKNNEMMDVNGGWDAVCTNDLPVNPEMIFYAPKVKKDSPTTSTGNQTNYIPGGALGHYVDGPL